MQQTKVNIQRKSSGNYILTTSVNPAWELIATCQTPSELLEKCKMLSNVYDIILAEYSQSQRKTKSMFMTQSDALYAFGINKSAAAIKEHFA